MLVYDNEHGVDWFHLTSRYMVRQDPNTRGPYSGIVEVEWAGPFVLDPGGFEKWLKENEASVASPDAFLALVATKLEGIVMPQSLRVTLHVETTHHGSYRLTKEGGLEQE